MVVLYWLLATDSADKSGIRERNVYILDTPIGFAAKIRKTDSHSKIFAEGRRVSSYAPDRIILARVVSILQQTVGQTGRYNSLQNIRVIYDIVNVFRKYRDNIKRASVTFNKRRKLASLINNYVLAPHFDMQRRL